ncbi:very-long-chain enoyl- reductase-like [Pelobates cultripes]|uniref:Very-long-chain enoyl- reductase-like n=1 Tax=Pelobates cultripes TaxID=61616 RepID=A0AAD1STQ8_PELCU|nr:very-long-chain enoyl- reductase-like [Pelobates cultripes]
MGGSPRDWNIPPLPPVVVELSTLTETLIITWDLQPGLHIISITRYTHHLICETGNFSVHVALNSMKADVPKAQRFPQATRNPFTWLYVFVSCPNYTYEMGSLISFAIMTQCIPAGVYAFIRFLQLTIWAREKHHKYLKDFKEYPRFRTSIIPLIL